MWLHARRTVPTIPAPSQPQHLPPSAQHACPHSVCAPAPPPRHALQLVEVLNEDYSDYVGLAGRLTNVEGAVARMRKPLMELKVWAGQLAHVGGWGGGALGCDSHVDVMRITPLAHTILACTPPTMQAGNCAIAVRRPLPACTVWNARPYQNSKCTPPCRRCACACMCALPQDKLQAVHGTVKAELNTLNQVGKGRATGPWPLHGPLHALGGRRTPADVLPPHTPTHVRNVCPTSLDACLTVCKAARTLAVCLHV